VAWYQDGAEVAAHSAEARPYLMLDQGLVDDAGTALITPVASDVEDLQFAYFYPPATAGGPPRILGATVGEGVGDGAFKMQTDVVAPGMDDLLESAPRLTGHPANIEAVRVSVMVRMPDKDVTLPATEGALAPALANRTEKTNAQPYRRRATFETTVLLRNLESTYFLYPVVD
jgi:hypothetical protein